MAWQETVAHAGYAMELVGLGYAAFGMWRSWKMNAEPGTTFWPTWMRAAYFKVARLWGQTPPPVVVNVEATAAASSVGFAGVAVGRVPGASVDQRLDRLEADVDQLHASTQKLAAQQEDHKRRLAREVESLRGEIARARQAIEQRLSEQTVTDLRPAAYGVTLAAFGLLLQWVGSG